jgi:galactonate dehydratase
MKITAVTTTIKPLAFRNAVFTFIQTDEGLTGASEVVMRRKSPSIAAHIEALGRFLVGRDPTCIEDAWEKMYRDSFWVGGPMHATALSAVDIACWDILGKKAHLPVYKLLGGPCREEILVYCHVAAGANPDEFAANALEAKARGFRAFKSTVPLFYGLDKNIKSYSGYSTDQFRSLKETEYLSTGFYRRVGEFFKAARQAVGPEMEIAIDCHGRFSPANALRLCEALAPHDLMFVEEPVPPENPEALAMVIARSPIPIASGERLATIYGAKPFLLTGLAMLQPDVVNCGGVTQFKKIAAMAEAHYIGLAPHNPNGPLATAASVQVCAAVPNFTILEAVGSAQQDQIDRQVLRNPLTIANGVIKLPTGPGLGVQINEEFFAAEHPYRPFHGWR